MIWKCTQEKIRVVCVCVWGGFSSVSLNSDHLVKFSAKSWVRKRWNYPKKKDICNSGGPHTSDELAVYNSGSIHPVSSPHQWDPLALEPHLHPLNHPCTQKHTHSQTGSKQQQTRHEQIRSGLEEIKLYRVTFRKQVIPASKEYELKKTTLEWKKKGKWKKRKKWKKKKKTIPTKSAYTYNHSM